MIITIDGERKDTGDYYYGLEYSDITGYKVKRYQVHRQEHMIHIMRFHSRKLCQEQCNLMNQSDKNI